MDSGRAYRVYQKVLEAYQRRSDTPRSALRKSVEWAAILLVQGLRLGMGVRFPQRAVGGWWWTWRFRLELLTGWFEYDTVQWCRRFITPGMVVADIGAHIGYYTWLFSRLVGPEGKVLAFEAMEENFHILAHNVRARRAWSAEPIHAAICDLVGEVDLFVSPGNSNHSLVQGYTAHVGVDRVPATSLDAVLAARGWPALHFLKSDTEGSEIRVLAGMRETLDRNPHLVMIVELNPRALKAAGLAPSDLIQLIDTLGYKAREIRPDGVLGEPYEDRSDASRNLLCMREAAWGRIHERGSL